MSSTNLSQRQGVWGSAKGFELKLFHEQIGNERATGEAHGSPTYLFIILTLEKEVCVLRQNCGNVIDVWNGHVGSCCNFCWTICIEGSTRTEGKRALTS